MNKLTAFKAATGLVVGTGVSRITKGIIDANIIPAETTLQKVLIGAGRLGISMTAAAIVVKHVDSQIDEYAELYQKLNKQVQTKVDQKQTP